MAPVQKNKNKTKNKGELYNDTRRHLKMKPNRLKEVGRSQPACQQVFVYSVSL